jgi:RNA polymerase sigma-70 factor, ECF subfamily
LHSSAVLEQPVSGSEVPANEGMLVAAARRGDTTAFERLYRLYCSRVLGLCLRMTRRRDIAEDCVQQTFIRAWRSLGAFEGRSAFSTWLHRIAVNEVLMHQRNRGTRSELDPGTSTRSERFAHADSDVEQPVRPTPGNERDAGELMDVERALATLPEGARHVVILQAIYGYSHEEVADMLGIAVGTCKAQLHRGRKLLRERLGLAGADA